MSKLINPLNLIKTKPIQSEITRIFSNKCVSQQKQTRPIRDFGQNSRQPALFKNAVLRPSLSATYCTKFCNPGRHNYHPELECGVNQQILAELNAGYAYLSMACYFGMTDVALPGCHGYFMLMHEEEHQHALEFINIQLMRGAKVKLLPLTVPDCQDWESISNALSVSVELEKLVKEKLIALYNIAEKHRDLHIMDVVNEYINEQERSICEIARLLVRITRMEYMGCGCVEYSFDKEIHRAFVQRTKKCKTEESPVYK